MNDSSQTWTKAARQSADSYRRMIDRMLEQLTDEELHLKPDESLNSVAVILRHLGGNLQSRWTDFLSTDGEKTWRNRDQEFEPWEGDRASLIAFFDAGWQKLIEALEEAESIDPATEIHIRGEALTFADAVIRSLTHTSYHIGQIAMVARSVHEGQWQWLTIPPGASNSFNEKTWGTSASRGAMGDDEK